MLDVQPTDRLLEFGCGPGVSVELVCARLGEDGFVAAVDRSATAVRRTLARVAPWVEAGRAVVRQTAFTASGLAAASLDSVRYDKIFSINVNLYWTGPATDELALARSLLVPGGRLYAFFEMPGGSSSGRATEIASRVVASFTAGGFTPTVTTDGVLCVSGT
jgi:cyclopropane fatty-acyl-phospholipid synthase-like methyltransferase